MSKTMMLLNQIESFKRFTHQQINAYVETIAPSYNKVDFDGLIQAMTKMSMELEELEILLREDVFNEDVQADIACDEMRMSQSSFHNGSAQDDE